MIEQCDDPECPGFGKQYVDRGYGYPVCPANKKEFPPIPMKPCYIGMYDLEE